MGIFSDDPNFSQNLMNFGFATMAAAGQPGATFGGAIGQGGMGMNQAAQQQAQTQFLRSEMAGKTLNNAIAMRGININNRGMGLPAVNLPGVPDLMGIQSQSQPQPSSVGAYSSVSPVAGGSAPSTQTRQQSAGNQNQQQGGFGFSPQAQAIVFHGAVPRTIDEAMEASKLAEYAGNADLAKNLRDQVSEHQKPQLIRPGSVLYDPMAGGNVANPEHVTGYNDQNVPTVQSWTPQPVINGVAGGQVGAKRNIGQGAGQSSGGNSQIRTGFSPDEDSTMKNFYGPEATAYNGAVKAKGSLSLMQGDLDTLNKNPNFLSTGSGGSGRVAFAKAINTGSQAIFGGNFYDPDKLAAGESLFKVTGNLGFDMSKQLGAREPGVITQQAIKLNPGMDNTPQGAQLIKNSLMETQQRMIDERAYKSIEYKKNGYHQADVEQSFDGKFPPELYVKRAVSLVKPIRIPTPDAAKKLLAGTKIITPDGRTKLVPPNFGVTPPSYQDIQAPPALPVELHGQDGEEE